MIVLGGYIAPSSILERKNEFFNRLCIILLLPLFKC
jgi:hypothetical protein